MGGSQNTLNVQHSDQSQSEKTKLSRDNNRDRDSRNTKKNQSKEHRFARRAYQEQVKQEQHIKQGESTLTPPPVRPIKAGTKSLKERSYKQSHYDMVQALDLEINDTTDEYLSDHDDEQFEHDYQEQVLDVVDDEVISALSSDDLESDDETGSVIIHDSASNSSSDDELSSRAESDSESSDTSDQERTDTYSDTSAYETESDEEITVYGDEEPSYLMEDLKAHRNIDRIRDHNNADKLKSKEYRFAKTEFVKQSKQQGQGDELEQPLVRPIKNFSSRFFMEKKNKPSKYDMVRDALALEDDLVDSYYSDYETDYEPDSPYQSDLDLDSSSDLSQPYDSADDLLSDSGSDSSDDCDSEEAPMSATMGI